MKVLDGPDSIGAWHAAYRLIPVPAPEYAVPLIGAKPPLTAVPAKWALFIHRWLAIALWAGAPQVLFRLADIAFHSFAVFVSRIAAFDKFGELLWSSRAAMPGKGILR
jgi:hypothetical protein